MTVVMKKILLIATIVLSGYHLCAQDHLYSQFLNSPLYLNPALTGTAENDLRFGAAYRRQWASVPSGMQYYSVFADKYIPVFKGGFGMMFTGSHEGYLHKQNVSAMYSYGFGGEDYLISAGIQGGFSSRAVRWEKLYFSDMINDQGVIPGARSQAELPINNNKWFPDFGAGATCVYRNLMVGFSVQHLNRPDESLTQGVTSNLPRRLIAHASLVLVKENYDDEFGPRLIPSAVYYQQGQFKSISGGLEYKNDYLNIGLWYRNNVDLRKNDAIVLSITLDSFLGGGDRGRKMRMGISHDATISHLGYTNTTGSTEGAFLYEVSTNPELSGRYRNDNIGRGSMRCYDFH
ncbi:hypothetical protein BC349_04115 [Flavihumibacter stibioxidans]|uniref:Type IX secretion system membrane protein PorP/SprF n=2 Tax=Flavihumibacter stibioxidans TaxID=1834163 RepID=A0ABR7M557_9BACT|nr:hypothetical protein [Flavihumibacter stibioxidans]